MHRSNIQKSVVKVAHMRIFFMKYSGSLLPWTLIPWRPPKSRKLHFSPWTYSFDVNNYEWTPFWKDSNGTQYQ